MDYNHARDYLLEMAGGAHTPGWLHDLIVRVVMSNGNLTADDITAALTQLKANTPAQFTTNVRCVREEETVVTLKELIHHSGVNALSKEQHIVFSDDITLLYSKNGTGKSSYFRILNEIVGGNRETRIYPNIFATQREPVSVDLRYTVKEIAGQARNDELHWDGTQRNIGPLNKCSVFDSEYTNDLLEKRSADTATVRPLGLHLFTVLTTAMETIKERLNTEIDTVTRGLPQIPQDNLEQVIKTILYRHEYSPEQKRYITERFTMSEEAKKALEDCEKAYKALMAKDFDANIKLVDGERSMVQGLKKHIETAIDQLTKAQNAVTENAEALVKAEKAADEARQRIEILNDIGETGTDEWKTFITAGDIYKKYARLKEGVCPYCRQELGNRAAAIVKAYGDYLADKTMATLKGLKEQKASLQNKLERVTTNYEINDVLENLLGEELTVCVKEEFKRLGEVKDGIFSGKNTNDTSQPNNVLSRIGELEKRLTGKLEQLNKEKAGKEEQLKKLNEKRLGLLEHKAIASQRTLWEQWFAKVEQIRELARLNGNINTRPVSTLSKTASQHLLTDSLREKFQEELNTLQLNDLEVVLNEAGARSGQSYMQIKLTEAANTREILSEGEQKGVALALFIAERRMEKTKNPIILDDPVNSLDHHITALLVERLVELGNQVIIFSHHILLRDSLLALHTLHECNKTQISSCGKASKHLFLYNVNAREEKGFIRDSKQDNARYYIQETQRVLRKRDFDEALDVGTCAGLLRQAIEHMVDEKIFKNLVPVKYRGGKSQTINWDRLKELQADSALIDMMHVYYNRLSGGDMHLGGESRENPIDWAELNEMAAQLFAAL